MRREGRVILERVEGREGASYIMGNPVGREEGRGGA